MDLDMQLPGSLEQLQERLTADFSTPEIIVHNLGGSLKITDAFASTEDWMRVWYFNVGIAHELNRLFTPNMVSRKWGRIVHLSTLSTHTHDGYVPYMSAKCALDGYVKGMSRLLSKDNVILNALAPGLVGLQGRYFKRMEKELYSAMIHKLEWISYR